MAYICCHWAPPAVMLLYAARPAGIGPTWHAQGHTGIDSYDGSHDPPGIRPGGQKHIGSRQISGLKRHLQVTGFAKIAGLIPVSLMIVPVSLMVVQSQQ